MNDQHDATVAMRDGIRKRTEGFPGEWRAIAIDSLELLYFPERRSVEPERTIDIIEIAQRLSQNVLEAYSKGKVKAKDRISWAERAARIALDHVSRSAIRSSGQGWKFRSAFPDSSNPRQEVVDETRTVKVAFIEALISGIIVQNDRREGVYLRVVYDAFHWAEDCFNAKSQGDAENVLLLGLRLGSARHICSVLDEEATRARGEKKRKPAAKEAARALYEKLSKENPLAKKSAVLATVGKRLGISAKTVDRRLKSRD